MQLKQFYDIATKVSSRKSATTFGDLPDCLWNHSHRKPFLQLMHGSSLMELLFILKSPSLPTTVYDNSYHVWSNTYPYKHW